jgi:hypothetical protein
MDANALCAARRRHVMHGLAVGLAVIGAGGAGAQDGRGASPLRLELNRLQPVGESCRAYLVIENPTAAAYRSLKLDLFVFDTEGVIARRVAIEGGPVPARKTSVKLFDFAGLACERLTQVLLNDVLGCETGEGARADCLGSIETGSKAARVRFVK